MFREALAEVLSLKQRRKAAQGGPDWRKELQGLQARERELQEVLKEAQFVRLNEFVESLCGRSGDHKEGQWLVRIAALQEDLKQKAEKISLLKAKEQELEAHKRKTLRKDMALAMALRRSSEIAAMQKPSCCRPCAWPRPRSVRPGPKALSRFAAVFKHRPAWKHVKL